MGVLRWFRTLFLMAGLIIPAMTSGRAMAVGFYTPPCIMEQEGKDKALKALDECLARAGHPYGSDSHKGDVVPCGPELSAFEQAVDKYRSCLQPTPTPRPSPALSIEPVRLKG